MEDSLFGTPKKKFSILVLVVLLVAIPITVWIAQRAQIFAPKADVKPIELISGEDSCVISTDPGKVSCASFPIRLTSPLGPPAEMISCTSDDQCSEGEECFNHNDYPGSCKPDDTVCAQVITRACDPDDEDECADFPTPCHVPPGWIVQNNPSPSPSASVQPSPSASAASSPSPSPAVSPSPSPSPSPSAAVLPLPAPEFTPVAFNCLNQNQVTGYVFNVFWPQAVTGVTSVQISPNDTFTNPYVSITFVQSGARMLAKGPGNFSNGFTNAFLVDTPYRVRLMRGDTPGPSAELRVPSSCAQASIIKSASGFQLAGLSDFISGSWNTVSDIYNFMRISVADAQTPALTDGLISYWNFNEATGNAAADLKGTHNGTATGTTIVNGKLGKARSFAVDGDKVQASANAMEVSNVTVAAWVFPTGLSAGAEAIINNSQQQFFTLHNHNAAGVNDGQFRPHFNFSTKGVFSTNAVLTPNTWSHVVMTRDGSSGAVKVYINGADSSIFVGVPLAAGSLTSSASPIIIGTMPGQNYQFKGTLDEIGIWNRTLSAADVGALYNGGQGKEITLSATSPSPTASPSTASSASPAGSSACINLVKNHSFELPVVVRAETNNGWQVYGASSNGVIEGNDYATTTLVTDWDAKAQGANYQVELQRALFGPAAEGGQYAEVDIPGVISLSQSVPTQANTQYEIKFVYSSRTNMTTPQKMGVYWNGQQIATIDGQNNKTELDWIEKKYTVTGVAGTSKLSFGALTGSSLRAGNLIDNVSIIQISDSCGEQGSPAPAGPGTVKYRTAETEAGLTTATFKPYASHPIVTDFTFSNSNPGSKQIWVEFIGADGSSRKEHIPVELTEPDPVTTSLDCSMDISKQNLKLTLNGSKLGNSGGKVTVDSKDATITSWGQNQVTASLDPEGNVESGKLYKVVLTKSDGKVFPEITCRVDTALISLGARLFCREPGKFDVSGVKAIIIDENGNKVNEEVTIDTDGIIKGLKTKLQVGKPYTLSIKAPFSLRKNADFIASNGTTIVTPRDDENFILPVGDIFPVIQGDGKINTPDRSEIVRQWSVLGSTARTADFNRDSRVNSIDWACMRYDFNKDDETIPDRAVAPGSSHTPSSTPSSSVAASVTPSSTPLPSGQRTGFFLLEPLEGGSYANGDEFIVNLNIWSQIEPANLFAAKLSFDNTALEVVRIEKGTVLTTWAEEFFDNQEGKISLVGGKPTPGLKTAEGDTPLMAKIIFKAKKVGETEITVTSDSRIFSDIDNTNILTSLLSTAIEITN